MQAKAAPVYVDRLLASLKTIVNESILITVNNELLANPAKMFLEVTYLLR